MYNRCAQLQMRISHKEYCYFAAGDILKVCYTHGKRNLLRIYNKIVPNAESIQGEN